MAALKGFKLRGLLAVLHLLNGHPLYRARRYARRPVASTSIRLAGIGLEGAAAFEVR
jgi:hypothetical protein